MSGSPTRFIVKTTLAVALATNGTLAMAYPAGSNPGTFQNGVTHRLVTQAGDVFKAPQFFTLSYGATTITLTWSGPNTIPVNTLCYIQLDVGGASSQSAQESRNPALNNTVAVDLKLINFGAPAAAVAAALAASQTVTLVSGSVNAVLNGSLASGTPTVVPFDRPRNVVAAWTNTAILTVRGFDEYGVAMTEVSGSGTSFTGQKAFAKVTQMALNATVTGFTAGSGNALGLPIFLPVLSAIENEYENGFSVKLPGRVVIPVPINQTDLLAGTIQDIVAPYAGYISQIRDVVQTAVTTGGTIQAQVNTVNVVGMVLTVASAAPKGTRAVAGPTTKRSTTTVVNAGDRISLVPASFATAGAVNAEVEFEPLGCLGTVVAGALGAAQSGTTGDIRGTYTPSTLPDGATYFHMMLRVIDPNFLGDVQYAG